MKNMHRANLKGKQKVNRVRKVSPIQIIPKAKDRLSPSKTLKRNQVLLIITTYLIVTGKQIGRAHV